MAAKLDIKSIEIRNFLSYGDYATKLDVSDRGPTLFVGTNGAGKSSLITAIIWCLFGRTVSEAAPGDNVVNWFVGRDCHVKLETNDGWTITRTRLSDNHNELIIYKDGDDATKSTNQKAQKFLLDKFGLDYGIFVSSVFCGQFGKSFLEMTSTKRKETIERLLGLDKINEYAAKAKEKYQTIESEQKGVALAAELLSTNIEKQELRIESMLEQIKHWDEEQVSKIEQFKAEIEAIELSFKAADPPDLSKLEKKWSLYGQLKSKIREYRQKISSNEDRVEFLESEISDLNDKLQSPNFFEVSDLIKLGKEHDIADAREASNNRMEGEVRTLLSEKAVLSKRISEKERKIEEWKSKEESDCALCEQQIAPTHINIQTACLDQGIEKDQNSLELVDAEIEKHSILIIDRPSITINQARKFHEANERLQRDLDSATAKIDKYEKEALGLKKTNKKTSKTVEAAQGALESTKPKIGLEEARKDIKHWDDLSNKIKQYARSITTLESAENPYEQVSKDLQEQLDESKVTAIEYTSTVDQLDLLFKHMKYIYRSYSDRRKIKSLVLSELIPFLNDRISHYLSSFDIDFQIKFTASLSDETDKWGYKYCSGGERKRIDLSIMFALYDLYMSLYGQQCNIMVMDEVDSRLDNDGVQAFAEIITDYFGDKSPLRPSSIFVISHKPELKDLFPSQITIVKKDEFSIIEQN